MGTAVVDDGRLWGMVGLGMRTAGCTTVVPAVSGTLDVHVAIGGDAVRPGAGCTLTVVSVVVDV